MPLTPQDVEAQTMNEANTKGSQSALASTVPARPASPPHAATGDDRDEIERLIGEFRDVHQALGSTDDKESNWTCADIRDLNARADAAYCALIEAIEPRVERPDPEALLERAADEYDVRATEFDSIGEAHLVPAVEFNERRAKAIRSLIAQFRQEKP